MLCVGFTVLLAGISIGFIAHSYIKTDLHEVKIKG